MWSDSQNYKVSVNLQYHYQWIYHTYCGHIKVSLLVNTYSVLIFYSASHEIIGAKRPYRQTESQILDTVYRWVGVFSSQWNLLLPLSLCSQGHNTEGLHSCDCVASWLDGTRLKRLPVSSRPWQDTLKEVPFAQEKKRPFRKNLGWEIPNGTGQEFPTLVLK